MYTVTADFRKMFGRPYSAVVYVTIDVNIIFIRLCTYHDVISYRLAGIMYMLPLKTTRCSWKVHDVSTFRIDV